MLTLMWRAFLLVLGPKPQMKSPSGPGSSVLSPGLSLCPREVIPALKLHSHSCAQLCMVGRARKLVSVPMQTHR